MSGQLKSIVKYRIWGKRIVCAKNGWTETICMLYDVFFAQGVAFWGVAVIDLH